MKRKYEIAVNVASTEYFSVEADSPEEALQKYNSHSGEVEQTCSTGGWSAGKRYRDLRISGEPGIDLVVPFGKKAKRVKV